MKTRVILLSFRKWVDRRFPSRESICLLFTSFYSRQVWWSASFGSRMCCMVAYTWVGIQGYFPSWNRRIHDLILVANSIFWIHFNFGYLAAVFLLLESYIVNRASLYGDGNGLGTLDTTLSNGYTIDENLDHVVAIYDGHSRLFAKDPMKRATMIEKSFLSCNLQTMHKCIHLQNVHILYHIPRSTYMTHYSHIQWWFINVRFGGGRGRAVVVFHFQIFRELLR